MRHRTDIVASFLKISCKNINSVNTYRKTNMTNFVLNLCDKYRWSLTSFGQYILEEEETDDAICSFTTINVRLVGRTVGLPLSVIVFHSEWNIHHTFLQKPTFYKNN